MSQLQPALMRYPRVAGILSILAVSLMLVTGCDRAGQKGETGSWFSGARVDTVTVRDTITLRDTIVIVDTMLVEWSYPASVERLGLVYQACDRCSFS